MDWYIKVLKKYAVFDGRARRQEYWMFFLFNIIISIVLTILDRVIGTASDKGGGLFSSLYGLAVLIPGLAVSFRRLHDTNRSGWWFLINLVPCVGFIVYLVFMVQEGTPGENKYGENPKGA